VTITSLTPEALPSHRLAELGLTLPPVTAPLAAYVPAVAHGGLVWSSGQLPLVSGALVRSGLVSAEAEPDDPGQVAPEEAAALARICALNALAAIAQQAGPDGIDGIARIVKVVGFVASVPGFSAPSSVVDGASRLLAEIFGDAGRSARSAVGVAALPLGAPVEVEVVAALSGADRDAR
jgi:enamine deaminase RidA (YjgF/YER057c/UK114 family)